MRGRPPVNGGWTTLLSLAAALMLATSATLSKATAADVADSTTAGAHADSLSQSLRRLFEPGGAPSGVSDLRAMQSHVQRLATEVKKSTVGVQVGAAWGSGVIISKDGYILTAAHVAGRPNLECEVTLADGTEVPAKTLGLYRTFDAGLMKITKPGEYPFADVGNSSKVREGQWCLAMGHPGGYQNERGSVLRLGRILLVQKDAITTDCTLVGGDSGGPLFDMEGHVIGINSRIAERLTTNMHVPVSAYQDHDAWNRMLKGDVWGHLPGHNPYLGVTGDDNSTEAKIATVRPGSPAEKYELKPGDVVVAFDGKEIRDFQSLIQAVADCSPNESVKLLVRRGAENKMVRVRLGRRE
jgi:serine protease Do